MISMESLANLTTNTNQRETSAVIAGLNATKNTGHRPSTAELARVLPGRH